jgi:hypothetical protein
MSAFALALLALQTAPALQAEQLLQQAGTMPKDLFYLAQRPSGTMFCDNRIQRQQGARFDKRYGPRLNRLAKIVVARDGLGWTANEIVVTPCYTITRRQAATMLNDFERDLRAFELRYGL